MPDIPIDISELTPQQRALFWPLVSLNLTVAARTTYQVGAGVEEPEKLRVFNELQHQILQKIVSIQNPTKWTLDDDELLRTIHEKGEKETILPSVRWAVVDAHKKCVNALL